jgi:DNA-binding NarL/FixJ family response regulator
MRRAADANHMSIAAQPIVSAEPAGLSVVSPLIRVLIADDHPLIIAGLRRTLEVVGEAHTLPELLALAERRRPSIVMMDMRMPGAVGVEGIERLKAIDPAMKVVVLSASDDRATIDAALTAGASAYVIKSAALFDVASVLRQASSGAVFHAPSTPTARPDAPETPAGPVLTDRERSILEAVVRGQTTSAISRSLWISEHTVKFHLTNIYRKLGVPNRASAVRLALEQGLVA